jgi:hypothetical protein
MRHAPTSLMSRKIESRTDPADDMTRASTSSPVWLLGIGGAAAMLEGCRLVGDIFRAGVFVGVVSIIVFVALFVGLVRLLTG